MSFIDHLVTRIGENLERVFGEGLGSDSSEPVEGGGCGGASQDRPIAVIEITQQRVKVWPVIDYTKLGLVAIGVLATIWKIHK